MRFAGKIYELDELRAGYSNPAIMAQWREPLARCDWEEFIWRHPRPARLQAFLEIMQQLSDAEYWRFLGDIWIDAEWPNANRHIWLDLFMSKRGQRHVLMSADDESLAGYNALPDPLRIYRGSSAGFARGMSWTLDLDRAAFFADRCRDGQVFTTVIRRRKVLAYFADRYESEVVIDPRRIRFDLIE